MAIDLDLQIASDKPQLPSCEQFKLWVATALTEYKTDVALTIRLVEKQESQQLNCQYRNKDKPTNVLSFPFEAPAGIEINLLGDLIVCADVVELEAQQQNKALDDHWAHIIIHGCLHLLGYDHIDDDEALEMESLERQYLAKLNISDPYQEH